MTNKKKWLIKSLVSLKVETQVVNNEVYVFAAQCNDTLWKKIFQNWIDFWIFLSDEDISGTYLSSTVELAINFKHSLFNALMLHARICSMAVITT